MRTFWPIAITGVICTVLTLLVCYWMGGSRSTSQIESKENPPGLIEAAAKGKAASVSILAATSETNFDITHSGSGVLISEDGYIVTNYHVIAGGIRIQVQLDYRHEYTAQVIGVDSLHDVALLKINAKGLPFLEFGNSDSVRIGEQVLAVGSPYGLKGTVTEGIISAKDRDMRM